eukprot:171371-Chlamydomonas_euryale.AAC.2
MHRSSLHVSWTTRLRQAPAVTRAGATCHSVLGSHFACYPSRVRNAGAVHRRARVRVRIRGRVSQVKAAAQRQPLWHRCKGQPVGAGG